jgi:DNA-binding IclR family transcriptional regulator
VEQGSDLGNATPTATVRRLTSILDSFLQADSDLGITQLAGRLGLAKSVVHRLVTALVDTGYLSHSHASRRYTLGPQAVRLGLVALSRMSIRECAQPILAHLAAETGETATLSVLDGDERVYADQVESTQVVRQTIQLGLRAPLYVGASGKAILAFLTTAQRHAIVRRAVRTAATRADGRPINERQLLGELEGVRQRGFATSRSERVVGAASAAAPVFNHHATIVGCVSVASVTVRHNLNDLARFGEIARRFADRLSAELGWAGVSGDEHTPAKTSAG